MRGFNVDQTVRFAIKDRRALTCAAILGLALCGEMAAYQHARADGATAPHHCMELAEMKSRVASTNGATWIDLTQDQFQFLRGVSIMAPHTPEGIPYGGAAALARNGDKSLVVFIDASRACDIMPVPQALVTLLNEVGDVQHEPPQGQDQ